MIKDFGTQKMELKSLSILQYNCTSYHDIKTIPSKSFLWEIYKGLKKLWFESIYLKLSNGKCRFSIICLIKKVHVCSQKPLSCTAERDFDKHISKCLKFTKISLTMTKKMSFLAARLLSKYSQGGWVSG